MDASLQRSMSIRHCVPRWCTLSVYKNQVIWASRPNDAEPSIEATLRFAPHCLIIFVSLRKTRFIQPHVLFTGVYLLKRLFVGFWVSRRASPFGAAPVFSFFASSALPPWRCAFSRFLPVVNLGLPVLASGSNCAVKPTRLRRAAYFRSLED